MKKYKRSDPAAPWICCSFTIILTIIGIVLLCREEFNVFGFIIYFLFLALLGSMSFSMIKHEEYVKTDGFVIHEFESWNKKKQEYIKGYLVEQQFWVAKYVFHWNTEDYVSVWSEDNKLKMMREHDGFKTKEDAMKHIISIVRGIMSREVDDKVPLKNIGIVGSFSVSDLKQRIKDGEFKDEEN